MAEAADSPHSSAAKTGAGDRVPKDAIHHHTGEHHWAGGGKYNFLDD